MLEFIDKNKVKAIIEDVGYDWQDQLEDQEDIQTLYEILNDIWKKVKNA